MLSIAEIQKKNLDHDLEVKRDFILNQKDCITRSIYSIGKELVWVKENTEHGRFQKFLDDVNIPIRTAQRFMKIFNYFDEQEIEGVPKSNLFALLSLDQPKAKEFIVNNPISNMKKREVEKKVQEIKTKSVTSDVSDVFDNQEKNVSKSEYLNKIERCEEALEFKNRVIDANLELLEEVKSERNDLRKEVEQLKKENQALAEIVNSNVNIDQAAAENVRDFIRFFYNDIYEHKNDSNRIYMISLICAINEFYNLVWNGAEKHSLRGWKTKYNKRQLEINEQKNSED